jgi:hypothetical protein
MSIVETINSLMRGAMCPQSSTETTITTAYDEQGRELAHYVIADSERGISISNGNGLISEGYTSEQEALAEGFFSSAMTFKRWQERPDGQFDPL